MRNPYFALASQTRAERGQCPVLELTNGLGSPLEHGGDLGRGSSLYEPQSKYPLMIGWKLRQGGDQLRPPLGRHHGCFRALIPLLSDPWVVAATGVPVLRPPAVAQQVPGDGDQVRTKRARCGPIPVEMTQRPKKYVLGQVLGLLPACDPSRDDPIDGDPLLPTQQLQSGTVSALSTAQQIGPARHDWSPGSAQ